MSAHAKRTLAVGVGAALGSVTRYLISLASLAALGDAFPVGTLAANILGSFVIAYLARREIAGAFGSIASAFWLAGFCGGLTTFSIFSLETLLFVQDGRPALAVFYVLASLCVWLGAAAIGWRLAGRSDQ